MYFDSPGKENTKDTINLALKVAEERNIKYLVLASSTGETAKLLMNKNNINVICVTSVNGSKEPGKSRVPLELRKELIDAGMLVLTTTHVLSGAERGISRKLGGAYPVEIMAHSLRMFSNGTKVGIEISIMALDAGLIPYGEPVIAIGGTGKGADTAIIITPSHASSIFETRIHEIICKPSYLTKSGC